ncbi:hypothetical protein A6F49_00525 [Enteractinococcus helveticum]|uniref:Uncharacterized protein n=1 Tax=Enteractinococcus helveticum TaxID=1837282 RepID=A0A1B7LVM6_9MICC|nr:hypothetical protein A6F49_00525 [Enteractinococcus helveticum]
MSLSFAIAYCEDYLLKKSRTSAPDETQPKATAAQLLTPTYRKLAKAVEDVQPTNVNSGNFQVG